MLEWKRGDGAVGRELIEELSVACLPFSSGGLSCASPGVIASPHVFTSLLFQPFEPPCLSSKHQVYKLFVAYILVFSHHLLPLVTSSLQTDSFL